MKLFNSESIDMELSLDESLHMQLSTYKLGRSAYTSLRHDLKQRVSLPAHHMVMQHKNRIMPMISLQVMPQESL